MTLYKDAIQDRNIHLHSLTKFCLNANNPLQKWLLLKKHTRLSSIQKHVFLDTKILHPWRRKSLEFRAMPFSNPYICTLYPKCTLVSNFLMIICSVQPFSANTHDKFTRELLCWLNITGCGTISSQTVLITQMNGV